MCRQPEEYNETKPLTTIPYHTQSTHHDNKLRNSWCVLVWDPMNVHLLCEGEILPVLHVVPWFRRKLYCNHSENESDGYSPRMIVLIVPDSVLNNTYQLCDAYVLDRTLTFHIAGELRLRLPLRSHQFLFPEALRQKSTQYSLIKREELYGDHCSSLYRESF